MQRGLYITQPRQQRLLSVKEIAAACSISLVKVKSWLDDNLLSRSPQQGNMVELTEIIRFLVRNGICVPKTLLPPKTKKVLFIAADRNELNGQGERITHFCTTLAKNRPILAETATTGRNADLTILTFAPDVVVFFLSIYNQSVATTFTLLAGMPELQIVLFVDASTKAALDSGQLSLPVQQVFCDTLPPQQLDSFLASFFVQ